MDNFYRNEFKHILTPQEMNSKPPFYITLGDNTKEGHSPIYHGNSLSEGRTKFEVIIIPTDISIKAKRIYDYKGHLEINKLYEVNLAPFGRYGLKAGDTIDIWWDEGLDDDPNIGYFPINIVFPDRVTEGILGIKDDFDWFLK
jgi:hypothetical protein